MIIVDNAVYSFGAQLSNGVPITPFKDDKEDREFLYLMNYLTLLKDHEDMREINKEAFRMEQVYQFNLGPCVHLYDYELCDDKSDEDDYSDTHSNIDEEGKSTADYTDHIPNDTDSQHSASKRDQLALSIQASIGALGGAGIYGGSQKTSPV